MSTLIYLFKGLLVGFSVAVPIGPIGILCIRKTLEMGILAGIAVGFGTAIVDGTFSFIAVLGSETLSNFLLEKAVFIKFLGGLFLIYLAYNELVTKPDLNNNIQVKSKNLGKLISTSFILTAVNPFTIISLMAIFTSIIDYDKVVSVSDSFAVSVGVFLGSMVWWLILSFIVMKLRHKLNHTQMNYIRYFSALILAGFAVFCFV